jgi:hypothetical protein
MSHPESGCGLMTATFDHECHGGYRSRGGGYRHKLTTRPPVVETRITRQSSCTRSACDWPIAETLWDENVLLLLVMVNVVVVVAINGFFVKMSSTKMYTSNSTHQATIFCQFLVWCQDLVRGIVRRVEHEYLGRCEKFVRVIGPPVSSSPLVESVPQYYFFFFLFARTQNTGSRYR